MKTNPVRLVVLACALALLMLALTFRVVSADAGSSRSKRSVPLAPSPLSAVKSEPAAPVQQAGALTATLRAASEAEIDFYPGNDDTNPVRRLPHLILHENGGLTPEISRTLQITVENVEVPIAGMTVTPEPETCTLANLPLADLQQEVTR